MWRIATLVMVLRFSLSSSTSHNCVNSSLLSWPSDTQIHSEASLVFCAANSDSTCCSRYSDSQLYTWFGASGLYGEQPVSAKCEKMSREAYCLPCDPLFGTGKLKNICKRFCDSWYFECKNDFFAMDEVKKIPVPCSENLLICSPLSSFVTSGVEFCKILGFSVERNYDQLGIDKILSEDAKAQNCFAGEVNVIRIEGSSSNFTFSLAQILNPLMKYVPLIIAFVAIILAAFGAKFCLHKILPSSTRAGKTDNGKRIAALQSKAGITSTKPSN